MVHIDEIEGFTELSKKHQEFLSRYAEIPVTIEEEDGSEVDL